MKHPVKNNINAPGCVIVAVLLVVGGYSLDQWYNLLLGP